MGIVRRSGRDAVCLLADVRERVEGPRFPAVWRRHWTPGGSGAAERGDAERCPPDACPSSSGSGGGSWLASSRVGESHAPDDLCDLHPPLAAQGAARKVDTGEPMHQHRDRFGRSVFDRWMAEEGPTPSQRTATCAIGEQAEVTNPNEAARLDVQQKASQEFVGVERQDLQAIVVGVVLQAEPDAAVLMIDESIIGQRDAVNVPTEVLEHLLRAGEGALRIDDPGDSPELTEEAAEGAAIGQRSRAPQKVSWPASNAARKPATYFARNTVDSARTGNKNDDRPVIHFERPAPTRHR